MGAEGARLLLSRVFGVRWIRVQCVVVSRSDLRVPLMGYPAFPFIGQGKARVIVEGEEENEKEKMSSRIAGSFCSFMRVSPTLWTSTGIAPRRGPIHHWCHAQASSLGHGAPLYPSGRRGEPTRLSMLV